MHTNPTEKPDPDLLREMAYERRDVQMKKLGRYMFGFFGFTVFCFVAAWAFLRVFHPETLTVKPAVVRDDTRRQAAGILQSNKTTKMDIESLRSHETKVMTSTSWANAEKTKVHIPVERAMELLAARGLPKTSAEVDAVTKGTTIPQNALPVAPETAPQN